METSGNLWTNLVGVLPWDVPRRLSMRSHAAMFFVFKVAFGVNVSIDLSPAETHMLLMWARQTRSLQHDVCRLGRVNGPCDYTGKV